ncbi:dual specificity protein phosphatase 23-like [Xyrauchen texanus]|uniref:dual specificity protein phosphatase 23-like n=1 Tax=Xyrauchen texanus TaxID=154827 RepID=UPI00224189B6|nr:dual specificity protein phosphatase 23-like [Xyrauchen texanus]
MAVSLLTLSTEDLLQKLKEAGINITEDEAQKFREVLLKPMATAHPPNFSLMDLGEVAGLAMPRMTFHCQYLLNNDIKHLVTLSECKPPYYDTCPDLTLHHILSIVEEANEEGQGVAVHCMHGFGRTGTMLACFLAKSRKISGIDAINVIRIICRVSIEIREQEQIVVQFYQQNKENNF